MHDITTAPRSRRSCPAMGRPTSSPSACFDLEIVPLAPEDIQGCSWAALFKERRSAYLVPYLLPTAADFWVVVRKVAAWVKRVLRFELMYLFVDLIPVERMSTGSPSRSTRSTRGSSGRRPASSSVRSRQIRTHSTPRTMSRRCALRATSWFSTCI